MAQCLALLCKAKSEETDGEGGRQVPTLASGWLDTEVAAVVEQVEQKRLAIVFHGDV